MIRFFMEAGPLIFPVLILALVVVILTLVNLVMLAGRWRLDRRRRGIDAILFWGGVAAILGFMGQWLGFHRMAAAIVERGVVNPSAVVYGLSESLLTPVAGMFVLVAAAFLWFFLRIGLWMRTRRAE